MTHKTLPPPPASNQQVREYTSAVDRGYNSIFVVATSTGDWKLSLAGSQTTIGTFRDRSIAIAEAKKQAAAHSSAYFVFDKAGELVETH